MRGGIREEGGDAGTGNIYCVLVFTCPFEAALTLYS